MHICIIKEKGKKKRTRQFKPQYHTHTQQQQQQQHKLERRKFTCPDQMDTQYPQKWRNYTPIVPGKYIVLSSKISFY
jgi:hypothetical protein